MNCLHICFIFTFNLYSRRYSLGEFDDIEAMMGVKKNVDDTELIFYVLQAGTHTSPLFIST
jgi:hypothetical protein